MPTLYTVIRRPLITEKGMTVKETQNTLVFVTRLDNAAPVAGARVSIIVRDGKAFWTGTTGADGSYSFNRPAVTTNTVYFVATIRLGHEKARRTALLYQGVRDVLTMQSSAPSATCRSVGRAGRSISDGGSGFARSRIRSRR